MKNDFIVNRGRVTKYKKLLLMVFGLVLMLSLLTGCKGSKNIQGTWHVQNGDERNLTLKFTDKKVTIEGDEYKYTQNAIGIENGIRYYGIEENGKNYSIIFPEKDKNIALMIEPESTDNYFRGTLIFAMNKKENPSYSEYAERYIN
ncbi:glycosyltransferase [Lactococcus cremoris]|uniref:glycosyltransferase n=1 Tax=Lactococcus lactis subsp. cremoris TaxID=1359 RepID=UPI001E53B910|nr:glycosyltransferase [Lactococcus cremoris]MCD6632208.1 glycosyltransferase [Lactococcus cremoris]